MPRHIGNRFLTTAGYCPILSEQVHNFVQSNINILDEILLKADISDNIDIGSICKVKDHRLNKPTVYAVLLHHSWTECTFYVLGGEKSESEENCIIQVPMTMLRGVIAFNVSILDYINE